MRTNMLSLAFGLGLAFEPLSSKAQQIACGQTITNSINSAEQTVTYTFDANAGETFDILALGQNFTNVTAEVYDPAQNRLKSCTNSFTGPLNATNSGTYTILIHADNSVSTGSYGLSLSFLTGRCGRQLIWGLPATNAITELCEVDLYTFNGNAGETAVLGSSSSNIAVAAFLSDPTGTIIGNWVNGVTTLDLADTGTYTVGVYSLYSGGTGTYSLGLAFTKLVPASYRLAISTTNGAATLSIWGQVGRATTVQYATDLASSPWLALTNFTLPWSPYRFTDWASASSQQRFYRTAQ